MKSTQSSSDAKRALTAYPNDVLSFFEAHAGFGHVPALADGVYRLPNGIVLVLFDAFAWEEFLMGYTLRLVRSLKGSLSEVWTRVLRARTFVVRPHTAFGVKLLRDEDLAAGQSVFARLWAGPLIIPDAWVVQTHDCDEQRLELHGAEGFEHGLLWDHEIRIGEAGPRCIVEYKVRVPGRRSILPLGIKPRRVFERRHNSVSLAANAKVESLQDSKAKRKNAKTARELPTGRRDPAR